MLISTTSAMDWDNSHKYKNEDMTVELIDRGKFSWLGLDKKLGEAELKSHKSVDEVLEVTYGNQVVMYYDFKEFELYKKGLGEVQFIDLRTGEEIEKDYEYVIWKEVPYEKDIFEYDEATEGMIKSGKTETSYRYEWVKLENNDIPSGNSRIGIRTFVNFGDHIDGIWEIAGQRIKKHASWSSSMNTGLLAYLTMNESTGNLVDSVKGVHNCTPNDLTQGVAGKINNSVEWDGGGDTGNERCVGPDSPELDTITGEFTISFWMKTSDTDSTMMAVARTDDGSNQDWWVWVNPTGNSVYFTHGSSDSTKNLAGDSNVCTGDWVHVVAMKNSTGKYIYINGTIDNSDGDSSSVDTDPEQLYIGARGDNAREWDGFLDEIGIWNVSLTHSQIVDILYNSGTGNTYERSLDDSPTATLNSPIAHYNSSTQSVTLNYTCSDNLNVTNSTLTLFNSSTITTTHGLSNETTVTITQNYAEGPHWWNVTCYDNASQSGTSSNRNFTIDLTNPAVTTSSPNATIASHTIGNSLDLNWSANDTNLETCWYRYNATNTIVTCSDNHTAFNTEAGYQNITFCANDTVGRSNCTSRTWVYNFVENTITYSSQSYETQNETFSINITTDLSVQSIDSVLHYNGSTYDMNSTESGSDWILNGTIDIPTLPTGIEYENRSFFWEHTIYTGTGTSLTNSSTSYQEVNETILTKCNASYNTHTVNFTAWNETTLDQITNYSFKGAFDYWLGTGTETLSMNLSNTSTYEVNLCLFPNETMEIDGVVEYEDYASSAVKRNRYFYEYEINSTLQEVKLYILDSDLSTTFIQEVLEDEIGVEDVYIYTHRYYPELDEWKITQVTRTDADGRTVGFYKTETVIYKHELLLEGTVEINETVGRKMIPDETPYTITWELTEDIDIPYTWTDELTGLTHSLSYDEDTEIVTFAYVGNASFSNGNLTVFQEKYSESDTFICNDTSTLSTATLSCNMTDYEGNFIAYGYIDYNGVQRLIDNERFSKGTGKDTFGDLGILIAWFILLTGAMVFLWNLIAGIIVENVLFILLNLVGLIQFSGVFIFAVLFVSIIALWLLKD
jgi:hypothetical protein